MPVRPRIIPSTTSMAKTSTKERAKLRRAMFESLNAKTNAMMMPTKGTHWKRSV